VKRDKIYTGDCAKVMADFPDECIDLTVTSPPYDNLRDYEGYHFGFEAIAAQLFRVTKRGGVVVWVVGDATINGSESGASFRQALYFIERGFNLHDTMIYYRWSGPLTHNRYEQEFEYMFVFSKKKPKTFNPIMMACEWFGKGKTRKGRKHIVHGDKSRKIRSGVDRVDTKKERISGNVWELNSSSQAGERHRHPAPFPEALARDHIISWSNKGDVVLDPMCGSGTTLKMARQTGRYFIGIDTSAKYVKISERRVASALVPLF